MTIRFKCSGCEKVLKVGDQYAGKRAKCPHCRTVLTVPRPPGPNVAAAPPVEPALPAPQPPAQKAPPEPATEEASPEPSPPEPVPAPAPPARPTLFVFPPAGHIQFPDHCVGCFADSPAEAIVFDVRRAVPPRGGPEDSVEQYHIPICPACRKMLPPAQLRDLAGHSDGMVDAARVTTRFLTREIRSQCVLLTLRNAEMVQAFGEANKGRTFNSIATCRSASSK
jgi:DNA-directed RNA polymerase subunit RPC12/RpoP